MYRPITFEFKEGITALIASDHIKKFLSKNKVEQVILEGLHVGPSEFDDNMPRFKGRAIYQNRWGNRAILIAHNPFCETGYGGSLDSFKGNIQNYYMTEDEIDVLRKEHDFRNYLWVGENYPDIDTITYMIKVETNKQGAHLLTNLEG